MRLGMLSAKTQKLRQYTVLSIGMICGCTGTHAQNEMTVSVQQLLEESDETSLMLAPAIRFYQSSGSGTEIQKVALAYYSLANCSGTSLGAYTTPDASEAFPISGSTPFSLNSTSVWKVAKNKVIPSIVSPQTSVGSIQINFRSLTGATKANFSTTPAGCNFSGNCCVPVSCFDGSETCTNSSFPSPQPFTFTAPQIGDAYGSGVVYRLGAGLDAGKTYILSLSDVSTSATWGPLSNVTTSATNTFNTSTDNTYTVLGTSSFPAALACRNYAAGSGTNPWFLPAQNEWRLVVGTGGTDNSKLPILNAKSIISGFTQFTSDSEYWSSTQNGSNFAYTRYFAGAASSLGTSLIKDYPLRVRCVRALTI